MRFSRRVTSSTSLSPPDPTFILLFAKSGPTRKRSDPVDSSKSSRTRASRCTEEPRGPLPVTRLDLSLSVYAHFSSPRENRAHRKPPEPGIFLSPAFRWIGLHQGIRLQVGRLPIGVVVPKLYRLDRRFRTSLRLLSLGGFLGLKKLSKLSSSSFVQVSSIAISQPLDVIKTRIQNQNFESKVGGMTVVRDLIKNEGFAGFFKGLTPKVLSVFFCLAP